MRVLHRGASGGATAHVLQTDRADGDLRIDGEGVEARRAGVRPGPWTWLRQVHGHRVVVVTGPGGAAGEEADAAVTAAEDAALAVHTADCASVALVAPAGGVGAVHAGWRGLLAGVVEEAVVALRARVGDERVEAVLGPCIGPADYEFGERDLALLVDRYGPGVRARTRGGRPALDITATVTTALDRVGVPLVARDPRTTASPELWSHRLDGATARTATVVWRARS